MPDKLTPVLQMDDLAALEAATAHMVKNGYAARTGSFADLPEADIADWMNTENGRYLLYLDISDYDSAMNLLGDFFGYVPEED